MYREKRLRSATHARLEAMITTNRLLLVLAAAGPLAAAPPAMAQATDSFVTSSGHVVQLDPPASLDCKAMVAKLDEIDSTNYRGLNAGPRDPRDKALFEYEGAVSNRYYSRCGSTGHTRSDAAAVFRSGFQPRAASN